MHVSNAHHYLHKHQHAILKPSGNCHANIDWLHVDVALRSAVDIKSIMRNFLNTIITAMHSCDYYHLFCVYYHLFTQTVTTVATACTNIAINDITAKKGSAVKPQGRVIIMDEVDGMGAGDRGGYVYTPYIDNLQYPIPYTLV
jgi:hypothetical protein